MPETGSKPERPVSATVLGAFLTFAVGVGSLIGIVSKPGYAVSGLAVPWYFPPAWMIAPLLLLAYIASAVAAWRIWLRNGMGGWSGAVSRCAAQLLLTWLWSPLFFVWQLHMAAFAMLATAFWLCVTVLRHIRRTDMLAARALRLCLVCLGYILCCNAAILYLNV